MRIKSIEIKNFRNYPSLQLDITNDMVIFSGPNAVGKTNLLESVYFASLFKSFRDDAEFIFMSGENYTSLKMLVERGDSEQTLEVYLEKKDKIYANFKIDGVKVKRKEAQGFINVVVFDPTDVDMFTKSPESRRKYLNMVLSQKDSQYLEDIAAYKKILAQKNRLLVDHKQGNAEAKDLEEWNAQLVEVGSRIIYFRKQFVAYLNQNISEVYTAISKFHRPVEVSYETLAGETLEEITASFQEALAKASSKELLLATSLVGPHRDDFFLKSDGVYLSPFSSRGEQRSQVLALKILELEYISRGDDKPILLLDDVLSELDETRRTFLLKYLQGKFQTLITTTHPLEMVAQHVTLTPSVQEEEVEQ
jgi:DNA replication and repair protein RecF